MADHSLLVLLATLVAAYGWTVFPLQNPQAYHYQRVQPTPVMRPVWPTPHFWIQNLPPLPEPSSLCEESSSRHEAITPSKVTKAVSSALLSTVKPDEGIDLVLPVLAPPTSSRARVSETAKEYPVLLLFVNSSKSKKEVLRRNMETEPIYVERLEDRINPRHVTKHKL
ncbi:unnamed protein product, partial [Iphiclides podalirius]